MLQSQYKLRGDGKRNIKNTSLIAIWIVLRQRKYMRIERGRERKDAVPEWPPVHTILDPVVYDCRKRFVIHCCKGLCLGFKWVSKFIKLTLTFWEHNSVCALFQELELYKPELVDKPAILILNKIDTEGAEEVRDITVKKVKAMRGSQSVMRSNR